MRTPPDYRKIALILLAGFVMMARRMNRELNAPQQSVPTPPPIPEIDVRCRSNHGLKQFLAIQNGMTLPQVEQALGVQGFTNQQSRTEGKTDVLIKFINRDGSSNEVTLHGGKVVSKGRDSMRNY